MSTSNEKFCVSNIIIKDDSSPLFQPKEFDSKCKSKENNERADKHMDEINYFYSLFEYSLLSASFSFVTLLLCMFINSIYEIPFYVFSLFGLATIVSCAFITNLYIKLKIMMDSTKDHNKSMNTTVIISYACFNLCFLNIAIYLVLLTIRQEILSKAFTYSSNLVLKNLGDLESSLSMMTISIPLFIAFVLAVFLFLFLLPAFLHSEMWLDILLYGLGISCSLSFLVLFNLKVDKDQNNWLVVCTPMITFFAYCIIYTILSHNNEEKSKKTILITQVLSWLMIISGMMIYFMDKDKFIFCRSYFSIALIIIGTGVLLILKLSELFAYEEESTKGEYEEEII